MGVESQRDPYGQRDGRVRDATVPRERSAPGPAHFQVDLRRRGQRATAGRSAGFVAIVLRHEGIVALLPIRRQPYQPRLVGRGSGRFLLLQRAGHLRRHRKPRGVAGLETGQV